MRVSNQKWLKYAVMVAGGLLFAMVVGVYLVEYLEGNRSLWGLAPLVVIFLVFGWLIRKGRELLEFEKTSVEIADDNTGLLVITERDSQFYPLEDLGYRYLEFLELIYIMEAQTGETLAVFDTASTNAKHLIQWCKKHIHKKPGV